MSRFAWAGMIGGIVVSALLACSSSSDDALEVGTPKPDGGAGPERDGSVYDSAVSPESGLGELLFRPNHVYSGTDGTHAFKIPIAVYDADADLTVTASDGTALTLAKTMLKNPVSPEGATDNGQYFMITALKAGSYTLTASSKGRSVTATVDVSSYDPARYAVGESRYTTTGTGADRPCTTCHVNGAAVDHSPAALATATDQEISIIITTGVKPGPTVIKIPGEAGTQHKWNVTDPQRDGLVTYLRGLEPRGFQ